jgi:hypothetical protein
LAYSYLDFATVQIRLKTSQFAFCGLHDLVRIVQSEPPNSKGE